MITLKNIKYQNSLAQLEQSFRRYISDYSVFCLTQSQNNTNSWKVRIESEWLFSNNFISDNCQLRVNDKESHRQHNQPNIVSALRLLEPINKGEQDIVGAI